MLEIFDDSIYRFGICCLPLQSVRWCSSRQLKCCWSLSSLFFMLLDFVISLGCVLYFRLDPYSESLAFLESQLNAHSAQHGFSTCGCSRTLSPATSHSASVIFRSCSHCSLSGLTVTFCLCVQCPECSQQLLKENPTQTSGLFSALHISSYPHPHILVSASSASWNCCLLSSTSLHHTGIVFPGRKNWSKCRLFFFPPSQRSLAIAIAIGLKDL